MADNALDQPLDSIIKAQKSNRGRGRGRGSQRGGAARGGSGSRGALGGRVGGRGGQGGRGGRGSQGGRGRAPNPASVRLQVQNPMALRITVPNDAPRPIFRSGAVTKPAQMRVAPRAIPKVVFVFEAKGF